MKRSTIAWATLCCCFFAAAGMAQAAKAPYTAAYSSSFKLGNPAYSAIILNMWKDWDDNDFTRHDYMSDTVTLWLPDGQVIHGKAAALEGAKKFRGGMKSCSSVVHAWVPLKATDKGDDLVCIWGTETDTYADGKVDVRELHEVWWFNKDGKLSGMRQFTAKFGQ